VLDRRADVRQELVQRPAAVDVHELAAEADAQRRPAASLDLGQQGELERLAPLVDPDRLGVPVFIGVAPRVHVVAAGEEDAVEAVDDLGDQHMVRQERDRPREPAGLLDRRDVVGVQGIFLGLVVTVHRHADQWPAVHGAPRLRGEGPHLNIDRPGPESSF
jgi:hypothetical protein